MRCRRCSVATAGALVESLWSAESSDPRGPERLGRVCSRLGSTRGASGAGSPGGPVSHRLGGTADPRQSGGRFPPSACRARRHAVVCCRLERLAGALGLGSRVTFHGKVDDAARLFPAFDMFVLSSRTEGTPIVLFEAMAAGVPVVATAVGGVPDVVSCTEALLVPPQDPVALAQAIRTALLDPGATHARVTAARARLTREFTLARWVARYDAVYQQVARAPRHVVDNLC
ncbi:MAG: hypothetical protein DMD34_08540 [Gemmatimonadetes bacterium]|nr:MAG: hypothetical protein DMD34_08540 [Gemmatimonadota bacterium]